MTTTQVKNPLTGDLVDADPVEIVKEINEPVILTLSNGTVLRLKVDVGQVMILRGLTNAEDEPMYLVQSSNTLMILHRQLD